MSTPSDGSRDASWLPCQYPERPIDEDVRWHVLGDCHACEIAAAARVRRHPDDRHAQFMAAMVKPAEVSE